MIYGGDALIVVPGGESLNVFESTGKIVIPGLSECLDTEYTLDSLLMRRLAIEPRASLKGSKEVGMCPCI
jgi:hypothetical protein